MSCERANETCEKKNQKSPDLNSNTWILFYLKEVTVNCNNLLYMYIY